MRASATAGLAERGSLPEGRAPPLSQGQPSTLGTLLGICAVSHLEMP